MKMIGCYTNGNYQVSIMEDGTKIRENDLDFFRAEFPENIDIKITNYCDAGCLYCHENSTKSGLHGNLLLPFIDTLRPYTELAIGGGNPLDHPDLVPFLRYLKSKSIVANLTVNQIHFERNQDAVKALVDEKLIYGLGVSMIKATDKFVGLVSRYPNCIIHVINGVVTLSDLEKLYDKDLKVLVLGYKFLRRGVNYYSPKVEDNKRELYVELPKILKRFLIVSFDNLALEQLQVKRVVSKDYWKQFYMGSDGDFTMYIDLVNQEFSKSSTCEERHPVMDNIVDMFNVARDIK
jgi:hypothetical protein